MIRVTRALVSCHDKSGLAELGRALSDLGVEIVSTGGTARCLREAGVAVTSVSDVTGFPEVFGGRVKTLHPRIHGGLLFRRDVEDDVRQAGEQGVQPIDLVVVNLYPFEKTVARPDVTLGEAVEEIDIGGPAMIRAAAKNHAHVAVVVDPADYASVLREIRDDGGIAPETASRLAAKAFARTASYDAAIAAWLAAHAPAGGPDAGSMTVLGGRCVQSLRYGENPHQSATAHVVDGERGGVLQAELLQGKELSYNNIADLDAAWCLARDLETPGCAIIKHANPCGAAEGGSPLAALEAARACDPVSAFGGIYAFNSTLDGPTARLIIEAFVECVIAPAVDDEARGVLARRKNVRVLVGELPPGRRDGREWKRVTGGFLVQDWDDEILDEASVRVVTKREPTDEQWRALRFAWRVAAHVKSNAILFAAADRTLGIGAGQMSRVDSVDLAVMKAGKSGLSLEGAAVASDAFFPFRDGVDALAAAGARAVIEPGGSKRDDEVIAAADEHDLAMVFTGRRHFRH